ncbi:hypothetical protein [Pseudoalteromonas luteoviolacea]|uniref:hypothetical protein n=1 Tax=Pseudoalteromonas luteoviolacea TaxID=43657 RepID=UPI001152304C|nr:hypothetical protein [Pseudoalteromonas luteoviolacea]TQF71126.1 hypothetical protein FLM44_08565 [Pseudoalteromonas luteoviolacea]
MRLLIYTALFSAFFFSNFSYSSDTPEFIPAKPITGGFNTCLGRPVPIGDTGACETIVLGQIFPPDASWSTSGGSSCDSHSVGPLEIAINCKKVYTKSVYDPNTQSSRTLRAEKWGAGRLLIRSPETQYTCPNPNYNQGPVDKNGQKVCLLTMNLDPDCPPPNPLTDKFASSVDKSDRCFDNPDQSVCQYSYSHEHKGFMIAASYGNQEWYPCGQHDGDFSKQPITASVLDPLNLEPLPDNLYGTQSLPEAQSGDNSDATIDIDALNQVNDNLTSLIDNNAQFDAAQFKQQNDSVEILKHLVAQDMVATDVARNTNNLLMPMSHNQTVQVDTAKETNDILGLMLNSSEQNRLSTQTSIDALTSAVSGGTDGGGNGDGDGGGNGDGDGGGGDGGDGTPCEGPDCETPCQGVECLDLSTDQGGKQGGLTTLFTESDIQSLKTEITEQIETNQSEIDNIRSELVSIMDIDSHGSASYESRSISLYGNDINISFGRFSNFYQALAPVLIFIASLSALIIVLGGRTDD